MIPSIDEINQIFISIPDANRLLNAVDGAAINMQHKYSRARLTVMRVVGKPVLLRAEVDKLAEDMRRRNITNGNLYLQALGDSVQHAQPVDRVLEEILSNV